MMDTTRGRRSLHTIIAFLAVILFALAFISESPPYDAWGIVLFGAIPAVIGAAIAVAFLLFRRGGSAPIRSSRDPFRADTSSDVINMARIRVAGFGGLGMVVVALFMALAFPRVGQSLLIGVVGGILAAGLVIAYRRRRGPLASGGDGVGGRSVLVESDDDEPTPRSGGHQPLRSVQPAHAPVPFSGR